MPEPLVYLQGRLLKASEARLPYYDAGLVMGATITELTRTFRGVPFRLEEHLARLLRGLAIARIDAGLGTAELAAIGRELVAHNATQISPSGDLALVFFVTAGELPVYAGLPGGKTPRHASVCVHTFPLPFESWAVAMTTGQHLVTPEIRHVPPECLDPAMKYRSRLHWFLADQQARDADPAASALLLDLQGNITETSAGNFFIVERGAIVSPTLRNILPGESRKVVLELAEKLGIRASERDITPEQALTAAEAFTTSSSYCLLPVTRLNRQAICDGKPGPVYARLLAAYSELVGLDIKRQIVDEAAHP
ncbi:MAG TPA: aminotransferase class IV [Pirellulales bacterium]|jgi:branched-subunit amino acid aminotransferase/4-amino-4-deoxychorismate lyase